MYMYMYIMHVKIYLRQYIIFILEDASDRRLSLANIR